jgi:hypothetical protein
MEYNFNPEDGAIARPEHWYLHMISVDIFLAEELG